MKISSGISELHLAPLKGTRSETIYLWPAYNAPPVQPIRLLTRETDSHIVFSKSSRDDEQRILASQGDLAYTERGRSARSRYTITPGILFDARA